MARHEKARQIADIQNLNLTLFPLGKPTMQMMLVKWWTMFGLGKSAAGNQYKKSAKKGPHLCRQCSVFCGYQVHKRNAIFRICVAC